MELTGRQLNRATLARQMLLERESISPTDAVKRIVAIQAQASPSPYIALWTRLSEFDPSALDKALSDAELVKSTLMRITLHVVHAEDHGVLHTAMQPTLRGARLNDTRFMETGLTPADADAMLPDLLEWLATPRTNAEAEEWLAGRSGEAAKWVWWAIRHYAPLRHHPTGGPWSFGPRPSHVAVGPTPSAADDAEGVDTALQTLILRYLEGFGPASVPDVAQFALVQRTRVRKALEGLGDRLELRIGPDGVELLDVPGGVLPDEDVVAPPRLLPMWDSTLLAYHDRSRIIPEHLRRVVIRNNGDVLPSVLVDGQIAGIWRTVEDGDDLGVEVTALAPFDDATWDGLAAEAVSLGSLIVDRDPMPYGRYRRWWDRLPDHVAEPRVLST